MFKKICITCNLEHINNICVCSKCQHIVENSCNLKNKSIEIQNQNFELYYFWDYEKLTKKIILNAKYKFNKNSLLLLCSIANKSLNQELFDKYTVTFIPTTYLRFCFRGFNTSKTIAEYFYGNKIIKIINRNFFYKNQAKLNRNQRLNINKNLFSFRIKAQNTQTDYNNILIIDDVCTTGSTFNTAINTIKSKYPNANIKCLCLAYTKQNFKSKNAI